MFGTFNASDLAAALTVTWQGMLGIFAVMALITVIVALCTKIKK